MEKEGHGSAFIRDLILGGQDGLVNVLGIVLAIATATQSRYVIIISGLAATFAESISMAAVAYTSAKAGKEYYAKKNREFQVLIKTDVVKAKLVVQEALQRRGFEGSFLNKAVLHILRDKNRPEKLLDGQETEFEHPIRDAFIVGIAAIVGSLIPLIPFFFMPISFAFWTTLIIATLTLFVSGAIKGEFTATNPLKSGLEMAIVGMAAAIAGYVIGVALGALPL